MYSSQPSVSAVPHRKFDQPQLEIFKKKFQSFEKQNLNLRAPATMYILFAVYLQLFT